VSTQPRAPARLTLSAHTSNAGAGIGSWLLPPARRNVAGSPRLRRCACARSPFPGSARIPPASDGGNGCGSQPGRRPARDALPAGSQAWTTCRCHGMSPARTVARTKIQRTVASRLATHIRHFFDQNLTCTSRSTKQSSYCRTGKITR
jgi:hypothetical protein